MGFANIVLTLEQQIKFHAKIILSVRQKLFFSLFDQITKDC